MRSTRRAPSRCRSLLTGDALGALSKLVARMVRHFLQTAHAGKPRTPPRHACEGRHRTSIGTPAARPARRAKGFRLPLAAELLSLCVATRTQDACANSEAGPKGAGQDARSKEKDNQRERPPRLALAAHRATAPALPQLGHPCPRHGRQVREPGPGFSNGHRATAPALPQLRHPCRRLSVRKGTDIPVGSRCAACRPRLTAAQGPRVEQRTILARTRCATAARWRERVALGVGWNFAWGERLLSANSKHPPFQAGCRNAAGHEQQDGSLADMPNSR